MKKAARDPGVLQNPTAAGRGSRGLSWAFAMLFLEAVECLVVAEVAFFDRPTRAPGASFGAVEVYFCLVAVTLVIQGAGIVLVVRGRYRLGGLLQIVSSSVHVLKGEGLIGVIGGMRARACASPAEEAGTANGGPSPA